MRSGVARLAFLAGLTGVGFVAGALLEQRMMRRWFVGRDRGLVLDVPVWGEVTEVVTGDGARLHVEIVTPAGYDPARDPTVIFSHGFALSGQVWREQRAALASTTRLVFWDQRSHGRSTAGEGNRTIEQLGLDLARVVEWVADGSPVVLVGHSMGGMTVMALAAEHPDWFGTRIRAVALLATSAGGMDQEAYGLPAPLALVINHNGLLIVRFLRRRAGTIDAGRRYHNDLAHLITWRYSFGSRPSLAMTEFVADQIAATPTEVIADFLPHLRDHDKSDALAALDQVEVLVMVGDTDLLTPQRHSRRIVQRVPHARLVELPDTGHMIINERSAEVNAELADLIERARNRG